MRSARSARRSPRFAPEEPPGGPRACEWPDCAEPALYRAPRSRANLREYAWFCLDHVREYNATWNYYAGMSEADIEADKRQDTVWQRPSWPLGGIRPSNGRRPRINDGFGFFADEEPVQRQPRSAHEKAMQVLELSPPVTVATVKARYKELCKRHHPDANGGDKAAEERFKVISDAYRTVMSALAG